MLPANPKVACVMLANGRTEMVRRAVIAFRQQTYTPRMLLVYDTTPKGLDGPAFNDPRTHSRAECETPRDRDGYLLWYPESAMTQGSIGVLRNRANALAVRAGADVIVHWDSDDWSAPSRIWDQLTQLYASAADAVGYHQMLFWNTGLSATIGKSGEPLSGGAWLYTSPNPLTCLGTSLMYWAKVWQANPFPDVNTAEDHLWCLKRKVSAISAGVAKPFMIASIHGENTCSKITPGAKEWKRAPESDDTCRRLMDL